MWSFLSWFQRNESSPEESAARDARVEDLSLYHFASCPFCVRVRHAIQRLGLELELRDIRKDPSHLDELLSGGGKRQVPCLRVERDGEEADWIYESGDILRYLERRFAAS